MTRDQLDYVVALTRHERWRRLTSEDNPDALSREGHRRLVERLAGEFAEHGGAIPPAPEPQPDDPTPLDEAPVPLDAALRVQRLGGRNCPHGSAPACGCNGLAACSLMARDVNVRDCSECLTTGPRSREVS